MATPNFEVKAEQVTDQQVQSAKEILQCIVTGGVNPSRDCMLTVVYSALLSLEIKLRATDERVEIVECQQVAAERRTVTLEQSIERRSSDVEEQLRKCVEVFERRTSTLKSTSEQLGRRTSTLESTSEQLESRTSALESANAQLERRTSTLESASQQLNNRTSVLEASNRPLYSHTSAPNQQFDSHTSALKTSNSQLYGTSTPETPNQESGNNKSTVKSEVQNQSRTSTLETSFQQLNNRTSVLESAPQQLDSDMSALATPNQQLDNCASTSAQQLKPDTPVVVSPSSPPSSHADSSSHLKNAVQKCVQDVKDLEMVLKRQLERIHERLQSFDERLHKLELAAGK